MYHLYYFPYIYIIWQTSISKVTYIYIVYTTEHLRIKDLDQEPNSGNLEGLGFKIRNFWSVGQHLKPLSYHFPVV